MYFILFPDFYKFVDVRIKWIQMKVTLGEGLTPTSSTFFHGDRCTDSSVGERQTLDCKFDLDHPGHNVVSFSKTLHPHCLVLS